MERFHEVEVTGLDAKGASQTGRVKGWPARILQHEVDHLDGILFIDRMTRKVKEELREELETIQRATKAALQAK